MTQLENRYWFDDYDEESGFDIDDDYEPADDTFTYEIVTLEQSRKGQAYVLHIHMESREDGEAEWENYRWKQKLKELPEHHRRVCIALAKAGRWGEELTEHFGRADDALFDHNEFRRDPDTLGQIPF